MARWLKNATIYHIFVDRFSRGAEHDKKPIPCSGPVFCGGNIQGIVDRLDYLQDLGINTILISPVNKTSAYHGYHITDFFNVDPRFGSVGILKVLIHEAHRRGVRILIDFVANHISYKHPYFLDAQHNQDSQYRNWFYFVRWPDKYLCFLSYYELPKLNLDYAHTRDHLVNSAKWWLAMGIDGFRLDHVVGPKHSFWRFFREEVKKEYPNAVLIGEVGISGVRWHELRTINVRGKYMKWVKHLFGSASDSVLKEYVGDLDGVLDFEFQKLMKEFIAKPSFLRPRWLLQWKLKRHYKKFPEGFYLPTFLDNHDMNRFIFTTGQDKNKLKEAAKIQFSQTQPPIIYYGTEIGLTQREDVSSFKEDGDLVARGMMRWQEKEWDKGLLAFYRGLIHERARSHALDFHCP